MFYFALVATLWRTASKYWNDMYHYEECWFAAVSCMCIRDFQLFRWWIVVEMIPYRSISVSVERVDETLWSWVMNSRDVIPVYRQTDEQYTSANFLLPDEHLHQDIYIAYGARCYCFNYYWWNIFRHPSMIHHIPHLQPGQRSLFGGTTKTSTSRLQLKLWIVIDNISSHFREAV